MKREYRINRLVAVQRDEILHARYIMSLPGDEWLEVFTHDGRKLQSELRRNQPDLEHMMTRMFLDGVRIEKVYAQPQRHHP